MTLHTTLPALQAHAGRLSASVDPAGPFLDALRGAVGARYVLTEAKDTERFRLGYRSGGGEAKAVTQPGTLLEL